MSSSVPHNDDAFVSETRETQIRDITDIVYNNMKKNESHSETATPNQILIQCMLNQTKITRTSNVCDITKNEIPHKKGKIPAEN